MRDETDQFCFGCPGSDSQPKTLESCAEQTVTPSDNPHPMVTTGLKPSDRCTDAD